MQCRPACAATRHSRPGGPAVIPPAEMVAAAPGADGHHVHFSRVAEATRIAGGMPRMVLKLRAPRRAARPAVARARRLPGRGRRSFRRRRPTSTRSRPRRATSWSGIDIQPGYYLYRDRLGLESATPGVTVGAPDFPVGEDHEDEYFGKQVIYRGAIAVAAKLGVRRAAATLRPDAQAAGLRRRRPLLPAAALDEPRRGGRGRCGRAARCRGQRRRAQGLQPQATARRRAEVRRRLPAGGPGLRALGLERQPRTASRCAGTSPTATTSIATR